MGQESKEKRYTIRMGWKLYEKLCDEAEQNEVSLSEYTRWKLEHKGSDFNIIPQLCRLSTAINSIMNDYEIKVEDRKLIDTEVEKLWQLLN